MHKDIRTVDPERGIVRITTLDERFYAKQGFDPNTGLPFIEFRPSVTYICDTGYPKGKGFEHWLKKNGDESDQIARLAADRGYKVHRAIALLNEGETVSITDSFENPTTGLSEPLTPDEYAAVMSYVQWWEEEGRMAFEILSWEYTIWPDCEACAEKYGLPVEFFRFAGTIDLKVRRFADHKVGIIDSKTSLDIWPSHEMQVSAYRKAEGADWAALLQLNYRRNKKKKWKFTEIPDYFDLFIAAQKIWKNEVGNMEPLQREFPLSLSLNLPKKEGAAA